MSVPSRSLAKENALMGASVHADAEIDVKNVRRFTPAALSLPLFDPCRAASACPNL